jgi:hypothetical protein
MVITAHMHGLSAPLPLVGWGALLPIHEAAPHPDRLRRSTLPTASRGEGWSLWYRSDLREVA